MRTIIIAVALTTSAILILGSLVESLAAMNPSSINNGRSFLPVKTIVVTGATGKVGSRLVKKLLEYDNDEEENKDKRPIKVVALVRDGTKARCMFKKEERISTSSDDGRENSTRNCLAIIEVDFNDLSSLESAFTDLMDNNDGYGDEDSRSTSEGSLDLFLACGNVPDQEKIELNVVRALAAATEASEVTCSPFCCKLSTARPVVEQNIASGSVHGRIEESLGKILGGKDRFCILRPHLFFQMLDPTVGGKLFGIDWNSDSKTNSYSHPLADAKMAIVDCDDVASCAEAILRLPSSEAMAQRHGGEIYELTGPRAVKLSQELTKAVKSLCGKAVTLSSSSMEEHLRSVVGLPPSAVESLSIFFNTLGSYETVTNDVERLTGRPAKSIHESVWNEPLAFLPKSYSRLVGKCKSTSFRSAAKIVTSPLEDEIRLLEDDEILVRVQVSGVNGGADTFSVTRASDDAVDFPLGNEGTGVVLMSNPGAQSSADGGTFRPGDTAVFVGSGAYGEYVRVKAARSVRFPSKMNPGSNGGTEEQDGNVAPLSPAELTAIRISALTAFVALTRTCPVQKGDVVLVPACCGGTGHFAIQVAMNAGAATVIGTVGSTSKVEHARKIFGRAAVVGDNDGSRSRVVDLSKEDLGIVLKTEFPNGVDVVYEGVGGGVLRAAHDNMADGGRILIVGSISQYPHNDVVEPHNVDGLDDDIMEVFRAGKTVNLDRGRKILGNVWGDIFKSGEMGTYVKKVYDEYSNNNIRVLLDKENTFHGVESVCDAVDHMLSRKSVGKVYVTMSD